MNTWGDLIMYTIAIMFVGGVTGALIGQCDGKSDGIKQGHCEAVGGRIIDGQCMRVEPIDGGVK